MRKEETKLRSEMEKAIREKYPNSRFYKIHGGPYQHVGIPDLVGHINGFFFAIEVKNPGGEPTKIQRYEIGKLTETGAIAFWCDSVKSCLDLIEYNLTRQN